MLASRSTCGVFIVCCLTWIAGAEEFIQAADHLESRIQTDSETYRSRRPFGALSIGIYRQGKEDYFNFGHDESDEQGRPVTHESLYEIGSCTKVFTGLALAILVQNGEISLDQTLAECLPDADISDAAKRITLKEIATHYSGLPRLPDEMWTDPRLDAGDPYRHVDAQLLLAGLKSWERPEPVEHLYSNYAFGLLGVAMTKVEGSSNYEELIQREILNPLQMTSTVFRMTPETAGFVQGYSITGEPQRSWNFDAMAAAGALKSNTCDMLKFVRAEIEQDNSRFPTALQLSQRNQVAPPRPEMGLGWYMQQRHSKRVYFHNGGTAGYTSFLAVCPQSRCGLIILSNSGDLMANDHSLDELGAKLLDWLLTQPE